MKVERFDIAKVPDHGRPEIVRFTGPEGELRVHVDREDGSLWLFALGPRGGDRGTVVFPVRYAERVSEWIEGGARGAAPCTMGVLWLDRTDAGRTLAIAKRSMWSSRWRMVLDSDGRDELVRCLRWWARLAAAHA